MRINNPKKISKLLTCLFLFNPLALYSYAKDFKIPAFKIGSGECNNFEFVKYLSKFKIPIIMSSGMNTISGIKKSSI